MRPPPTPWRRTRLNGTIGALLMLLAMLTGCESASSSNAPLLTVQANRSPRMGPADVTTTQPRTFRFRYVNAKTQELIVPRQDPLLNALARQGFVPAARDESPDTVIWIAAIENLRQEVKSGSMMGPPVSGNEDSIRYKNAAAMFGRHRNTLSADRNSPGEAVIDPEGNIIMTGSLGSSIGEDSTDVPRLASRTVMRQRNVLAVWATETAAPVDSEDDGELWRVEILSDLPMKATPPTFDELVSMAAQHLAQQTDGLKKVPLAAQP